MRRDARIGIATFVKNISEISLESLETKLTPFSVTFSIFEQLVINLSLLIFPACSSKLSNRAHLRGSLVQNRFDNQLPIMRCVRSRAFRMGKRCAEDEVELFCAEPYDAFVKSGYNLNR